MMTTDDRVRVARPIVRMLLVALSLGAAAVSQASGQDNLPVPARQALLENERDQKSLQVAAPTQSFLERTLYRYDNRSTPSIFGSWHGLHLAGGSFPAGAGLKAGVGFNHLFGSTYPDRPNRLELASVAAYSTRGYTRVGTGLDLRNVGGAPIDVRVRGQYYEYPQEDFFGLGRDSQASDRTNYLLRGTEAEATLQWKPVRLLEFGAGAGYLRPRVGSGTDIRYPSTEAWFDASTLPGFDTQSALLRADASASLDWRDNPMHPRAGGNYLARFSNFIDRDRGAFGFRRVEIDLQQYVPLPHLYRTLALRARTVVTDADAGQQVPFYYQPTLGGSQTLRGFREFRFRDRNSLALTAEYRWEAWWALDGALFVDAGTVASDRRDLRLRDMDVSYGLGFRLHSNRAFVSRLDLAFSREGFIPLLRFEHVF